MAFWQFTRLKFVYPVILLILFFLDGTLMSALGGYFTHFPFHILPMLTFVWLFFGIQFKVYQDIPFWWYVLLIGVMFDAYYTGIFGTYIIAFLLGTLMMKQLHYWLDERIIAGLLLLLIGIVVYLIITYFAGFIIGIANISLLNFLIYQLVPTVILNVFIGAIFYYPTWSFFQVLN